MYLLYPFVCPCCLKCHCFEICYALNFTPPPYSVLAPYSSAAPYPSPLFSPVRHLDPPPAASMALNMKNICILPNALLYMQVRT